MNKISKGMPKLLVIAALSSAVLTGTAHASLLGSTVTVTGEYGCTNSTCAFGGPTTQVVTSSTVFNAVAFDGTVTVTGTQLIWTATLAESYGGGGFNGFEFDFAGAPPITSVTVDPATTLGPSTANFPSGFQVIGNTVWMDLSGLSATAGQETILDITTSPVPLPASAWLMLSGLVGLGVMARMRRAA
jgi:hypothetical protein